MTFSVLRACKKNIRQVNLRILLAKASLRTYIYIYMHFYIYSIYIYIVIYIIHVHINSFIRFTQMLPNSHPHWAYEGATRSDGLGWGWAACKKCAEIHSHYQAETSWRSGPGDERLKPGHTSVRVS